MKTKVKTVDREFEVRTAPRVFKYPQRSAEWHQARAGRVTGSMAAVLMDYYVATKTNLTKADEYVKLNSGSFDIDLMNRLREEYPVEYCLRANVQLQEKATRISYRKKIVAERITGMPIDDDVFVNKAMKWGIINEIHARERYRQMNNMYVEDAYFMLDPNLEAGASPDGIAVDLETGEVGNVEIKCLTTQRHLYEIILEDKMPTDYFAQVQMQLWTTKNNWCDFVGYDSRVPEEVQVFIKRMDRDNFYIDEVLEPAIIRFLDECDRDVRKIWAIIYKKREQKEMESKNVETK